MTLPLLILGIGVLSWSFERYAAGGLVASFVLFLVGATLVWLAGYLFGFGLAEETAKAPPDAAGAKSGVEGD